MTLISPLVKELLEDELVTEVKYTAANGGKPAPGST